MGPEQAESQEREDQNYVFIIKTPRSKNQSMIQAELNNRFSQEMSQGKIANLAKAIWTALHT